MAGGHEHQTAGGPAEPAAATNGARGRTGWKTLANREFLRYLGPGFIVAVGFVDPGNWATNIAGGSQFGYRLLWVLAFATLLLVLFQSMAARLGIASGHSLAYNVRRRFGQPWRGLFGVSIVLACIATDVAEVMGGAIGFGMLFGFPLWLGGLVTVLIKLTLITLGRYHEIERLIVAFLAIIASCYLVEVLLVRPDWEATAAGAFIPRLSGSSLLIAMGILGAVVMPHNIYLHSAVILSRDWEGDPARRRQLVAYERADTALSVGLGWLVNGAMIIVAAAVFFRHGIAVTSIEQASATLEPLAGSLARFLFSVAFLLAGLGSSITSSMAEANVITGYLGRPEDPRSRLYRMSLLVTAAPALAIVAAATDPYRVLVLSQVALGIQLPLTILPLLLLVRDRRVMGRLASGRIEATLGILGGICVVTLDALLLVQIFKGGI